MTMVDGPPPGLAPGIDAFVRRMYTRTGVERIPAHLEERYGVRVTGTSELDLGVFRVHLADGRSWVARLFPSSRPIERVTGDAEILGRLAALDFSSERCATPDPVSRLDGQGLIVTEFVAGAPGDRRREAIRRLGGYIRLGALLGRLHTMPAEGAFARPGGCWHHLGDGRPDDEIDAAQTILADAAGLVPAGQRGLYDEVAGELAGLDRCHGLPEGLTHPDPVMVNAVATPDRLVLVDWTGAGWGPRIWSLAFLLYAAAAGEPRRVDSVAAGYTRHVRPEPEELDRLAGVIRARPVIFAVWAFCVGRRGLPETAREVAEARRIADAIAERAAGAFRGAA
ncbi:MAG TPA: phosphotransferase [Candidatus Dormibacteraeota bacterium]|jgi:Ser/Thr protein kinase RdoA (MazF antagonist)|nr:phosphotransferase [Candidatus Dormibacteraeota bacterium]